MSCCVFKLRNGLFYAKKGKITLKPDNKKYEDITISENDTFYIIGKVLV